MSQNMADPNFANGIPPQMKPIQQQFNGVHSSHSSRSSSPSTRLDQMSDSQLPGSRHNIPASQLPPSRSSVAGLTQKTGQLSVSNQNTPNVSPKFSTSTPNQLLLNSNFGQHVSPIPPQTVPKVTQQAKLESVPLNNSAGVVSQANNPPQVYQTTLQNQFNLQKTVVNSNAVPQYINQGTQQAKLESVPLNNSGSVLSQANNPAQVYQTTLQNQFNPQKTVVNSNAVPQYTNQGNYTPHAMYNSNLNGSSTPQNNRMLNFNTNPTQVASQPQFLMQNANQLPRNVPPTVSAPNLKPTQHANQLPRNVPPTVSAPNLKPTQQIGYSNGPLASPPISQPQYKANLHSNRYPTPQQSNLMPQQQPYQQPQQLPQQQHYQTPHQQNYQTPQQQNYQTQQQQPYQNITTSGFSKYWGQENFDLLQNPNILPPTKLEAPQINLGQELLNQANCSPEIFRCTMTKIPENNSLLQKSRLPLGVLIHPFKDLSHLPVIQCNVIVRCRACRTYINPFVFFVDSKRWKCNLCYRINELPEEFQYDPVSKTYGDPSRRPEIKASTIEYIAPAEYMLRPPQPAVYLFLLDISRLAIESDYLATICSILTEELKNLPGDARTQIGFIAYDSALHFFSLAEGLSQPHEMTVLDIDEAFLPTPDNLLVNLKDKMDLVFDLLSQLPTRYANTFDSNSALGAALQMAYKMMSATGGRVTVFQAALPNIGPGALTAREDPNQRAAAEVTHLNPANDFYKRLALECSGQQIAVDLFIVNSQYVDVATISGISRFSGGCIHHFPLYKSTKPLQREHFEKSLRRYLTRKIGFEAVMRIRCTRGLAIHTFHGNFFVRSTDLLSLPNINPDAGFGMQVSIEESLSDVQSICFQAALLYTSSKGERRIRVHTMCLPIVSTLHDIIHSADQQCIIGLLSKMAVDRSMQSSLSDAREAFINVAIDILSSYKLSLNLASSTNGLLAPNCLRVLPLYICALLKHPAFRTGTTTRLDDRVKAMIDMKTKPLYQLIQQIYPDLYAIHNLESQEVILNADEEPVPVPPKLQLTARCLDNKGAFLMDTGEHMVVLVCPNVSQVFLNDALGVTDYNSISDQMYEVPILDNLHNQRLHQFINYLNDEKPFPATIQFIRDNSPDRMVFLERLIEDRVENALSYHEFLQHLKTQVK